MRQNASLSIAAVVSLFVFGLVLGPVADSSLHAQTNAAADFAYTGNKGPGFWDQFSPACAESPVSRQSPINIDLKDVVEDPGLRTLRLYLPEGRYTLKNPGYTVQANALGEGTLVFRGVAYKLLQFHFHTLSEHTIDWRHGEMELHVVFVTPEKEYAVIGVLFRIGAANPFLERLIAAGIPQKTSSPAVELDNLKVAEALTDTSSYFTYPGSLTTPDCNETVTWIVLKQWAEMSPEQFHAFRHVLGNDFRPLQDRNGRVIQATSK